MLTESVQDVLLPQLYAKTPRCRLQEHRFLPLFVFFGPPAKLEPLKIEPTPDGKIVSVQLRNYSQGQRAFLSNFVSQLFGTGLEYFNPSALCTYTPVLVQNTRSANVRHYCGLALCEPLQSKTSVPMSHLNPEMSNTAGVRFFELYGLFQGFDCCWYQVVSRNASRLTLLTIYTHLLV